MRNFLHSPDLKKWVREIFQSDISVTDAIHIIQAKIENHKIVRPSIFSHLAFILSKYQEEVNNNGKRISAFLDLEESYQIKSAESIIEKIWRSQQEDIEKDEGQQKYTLKNFHEEMEDIMRFRILCNYLCDIKAVRELILQKMVDSGYIKRDYKDSLYLDPQKRRKGHRAIQIIFEAEFVNQIYLFEVQIMTLLQNAWDRKDHHLNYEYHRKREKIPMEIKIRFYAMSEMLFIADDFFNEILLDLSECAN